MKKRIAIVLAVVLLFTFVGSAGADGPFTWDTGFQVQNLGTATANITITYYRQDGSVAHTVSDTVPPGESKNYYQPHIDELGTTFDGSVVITSDQPIAAIANQTSYSQTPNLAASYNGVSEVATRLMAPIIYKNYGGWTTRLAVQNAGSAPANVTVTYRRGTDTWTEGPIAIAPGARHTFDQKDSPIPDGFFGSAVVESDQPVAAVVNEINPTGIALSYACISSGATRVYAPLLYKRYGYANGWISGLQVQNMGATATHVTVTYRSKEGDTWVEEADIDPGTSHTFYQGDPASPLPDGFIGSAVVESSQEVAVIVNYANYAAGQGMSYNPLSGGTTKVYAPLLYKRFGAGNAWVSGIQVQNVGDTTTRVRVTYHQTLPTPGGPWTEEADIEPGTSYTFYQGDPASPLPDNFLGSAVVESLDGQPIIAVVNYSNYSLVGDAGLSYTAINQ